MSHKNACPQAKLLQKRKKESAKPAPHDSWRCGAS
jgi:hypothetical protein